MKKIILTISVLLIAAGISFADNDDHYYSKQDVFKKLDENNDGILDFKEFTKIYRLDDDYEFDFNHDDDHDDDHNHKYEKKKFLIRF
jgi:hypothetical protein